MVLCLTCSLDALSEESWILFYLRVGKLGEAHLGHIYALDNIHREEKLRN